MSLLGSFGRTLLGPIGAVIPKTGVGASIGNFLSSTANQFLPQTYSNQHPLIGAAFGSSVPYQQGQVQGASTGPIYGPAQPQPSNVYGPTQPSGGYAPSTGGQSVSSGGSYTPTNPTNSVIANTNNAYNLSAADIAGYGSSLDNTYNQAKSDLQSGLDQQQAAATAQKQSIGQSFGDLLNNQLHTYQDLNRQRQGMFSSLGTLDSSAFGEQQLRADQSYGQQTAQTGLEQQNETNAVDSALNGYKAQINSGLATLANNYQQGKDALASALANNDIQRAQSINSTLTQIQQQAAYLQALGVQTGQSIKGVNPSAYTTPALNSLNQSYAQGQQTYTPQASTTPGSGYIAPNGQKYASEQDYQLKKQQGLA